MIALTEYVSMAWVMFVVNAKDRACSSYYYDRATLVNVSSYILFRITDMIRDVLTDSGLHKCALRMNTEPLLTKLANKQCTETGFEET